MGWVGARRQVALKLDLDIDVAMEIKAGRDVGAARYGIILRRS